MTYIRIRVAKRGGHYHCRLFTSQNYEGTFANCGELVFDEREFADVRDKLSRCEWVDEAQHYTLSKPIKPDLSKPYPSDVEYRGAVEFYGKRSDD